MKKTHLSVFLLAMMNVAVIMSLRRLPMMAEKGLSLLFYLAFSAVVILIPISLVSAELATGWPEGGRVYRWVKEVFGDHVGFTAICLQSIQNMILPRIFPRKISFSFSKSSTNQDLTCSGNSAAPKLKQHAKVVSSCYRLQCNKRISR